MASEKVNKYIKKRYERWLDYSVFHCTQAGIIEEARDVLNEVLCYLLQKDDQMLLKLMETKKNGYTELDFFILKMIKLNVCSPTSPYQSKYKSLPIDVNVDYSRLDIEDEIIPVKDINLEQLTMMRQVREVFEALDLSPLAKKVFEYRFFHGEAFSEWDGPETLKQLYEIYNGVQELIKMKINNQTLF